MAVTRYSFTDVSARPSGARRSDSDSGSRSTAGAVDIKFLSVRPASLPVRLGLSALPEVFAFCLILYAILTPPFLSNSSILSGIVAVYGNKHIFFLINRSPWPRQSKTERFPIRGLPSVPVTIPLGRRHRCPSLRAAAAREALSSVSPAGPPRRRL